MSESDIGFQFQEEGKPFANVDVDHLIELWRQRPILWDASLAGYLTKKTHDRDVARVEIARAMNISVPEVKVKLKTLNDYYTKAVRKKQIKKEQLRSGSFYARYLKKLRFLGPSKRLILHKLELAKEKKQEEASSGQDKTRGSKQKESKQKMAISQQNKKAQNKKIQKEKEAKMAQEKMQKENKLKVLQEKTPLKTSATGQNINREKTTSSSKRRAPLGQRQPLVPIPGSSLVCTGQTNCSLCNKQVFISCQPQGHALIVLPSGDVRKLVKKHSPRKVVQKQASKTYGAIRSSSSQTDIEEKTNKTTEHKIHEGVGIDTCEEIKEPIQLMAIEKEHNKEIGQIVDGDTGKEINKLEGNSFSDSINGLSGNVGDTDTIIEDNDLTFVSCDIHNKTEMVNVLSHQQSAENSTEVVAGMGNSTDPEYILTEEKSSLVQHVGEAANSQAESCHSTLKFILSQPPKVSSSILPFADHGLGYTEVREFKVFDENGSIVFDENESLMEKHDHHTVQKQHRVFDKNRSVKFDQYGSDTLKHNRKLQKKADGKRSVKFDQNGSNVVGHGGKLPRKRVERKLKMEQNRSGKVKRDRIPLKKSDKYGSCKVRPSGKRTRRRKHGKIKIGQTYHCELCNTNLKGGVHVIKHLKNHVILPKRKEMIGQIYRCDLCNINLKPGSHVSVHMRNHVIPKMFKCDMCDYSSWAAYQVKQHRMLVHLKRKRFLCQVCGRPFGTRTQVMVHQGTHTGAKPYVCHLCGKCFTINNNLVRHMHIHTGTRQFKCKFCDKRFIQKSNLIGHERNHTGEKPFCCEKCGKNFKVAGQLKRHQSKSDPDKPCGYRLYARAGPFKCDLCGERYATKFGLFTHKFGVHEGKTLDCDICGKHYDTMQKRAQHALRHSGERPFSCTFCGKSFNAEATKNKHQKLHTDKGSHPCGICGKVFTMMEYLKAHIKTHNKQPAKTCAPQAASKTSEATVLEVVGGEFDETTVDSFSIENETVTIFICS